MLTFRLWFALHQPYSAHPLYRRMKITSEGEHDPAFRIRDLLPEDSAWGSVLLLLALVAIAIGGWRVLVFLLFLVPLILLSVGSFCGLLALFKTSRLIMQQTAQGKQVLMGVTPGGLPGMLWALCSFAYHKRGLLRTIRETMRGVYLFSFLVLVVPTFFLLIFTFLDLLITTSSSGYGDLSGALIGSYSLLTIAYLDLVQSILVGCLLGMLIPTYTHSLVDSGGLALGAFLAIQFLTYAFIALIDLLLLPQIAAQSPLIDDNLLRLIQLFTFFCVREVIIVALWRLLIRRIEATPAELHQVMGM